MAMTIADEARALAARLAAAGLPPAPIVVYGSSTVRLWQDPRGDLGRDDVVAVGFGGATLADCRDFYDVLVEPLRPRALVVAAGANDFEKTAAGITDVLARLDGLTERARRANGAALPVLVLTLKPAPFHAPRLPLLAAGNRELRTWAAAREGVTLVDIFTPFLDAGGMPDAGFYAADRRHLNAPGYRIWSSRIRDALLARGL